MGKKKENKKKGKGAEKTALKTEKKAAQKLKRELKAKGEEIIEQIIAQSQEEDRKRKATTVEVTDPPSLRTNFTLTAHPDKDELILFGGEYFNGSKTVMYNDLYIYNIKKKEWVIIKTSNSPAPRSSHQAVAMSRGGGQLWVFGGEFDSPSQSQFHHFNDLWLFHLQDRRWEKVSAVNGPSGRSGHRMIALKKQLMVFGGFQDYIRDYKYFNDVHVFDIETYSWHRLEPSGLPPAPRSGCCLVPTVDGTKVLMYGGYSKERVKKDVDKGSTHRDMYYLHSEKTDSSGLKWKWVSTKPGGTKPSPRCGFSVVVSGPNKAAMFGGVYDEEDEDDLSGTFYGDLYQLEVDKARWHPLTIAGKKDVRRRRRREKGNTEDVNSDDDNHDVSDTMLETMNLDEVKTSGDGIFTVSVGGVNRLEDMEAETSGAHVTRPRPRMNAGLAVKHGVLYVYGGSYEDGDRQFTLGDMYSIDLHKLTEWQVLIPPDIQQQVWIDSSSDSSSSDEGDGKDQAEGGEDSEEDDSDEETSDEEEMETG